MSDIYGLKFTLSNYCGFRCKYCFVKTDEKEILDFDIYKKLVDYYLFQSHEKYTFIFLGGEVLLIFDIFIKYIDYIRQYNDNKKITIHLVTSGLGITPQRVKVLHEKGVLLGISIDGPEHIDSKNRVDKNGNPTFRNTLSSLSLLNNYYGDSNLGYTITVDEKTVYSLFGSFIYLSNLDVPRRNVGIAATYTVGWSIDNVSELSSQLKKICDFIILNIQKSNFYYYNILGFFILQILKGKRINTGNLEMHIFPDGQVSEMLFIQSKWENKTEDPNHVRFEIVQPYAYKIIKESYKDNNFKAYIESLLTKAIF
ncbi:radical SAM protein [Candidatus Gracilibacteria bacterium]|nr:radical SAM protein [Candidatus Gracilibacteria bacterium]